MNNPFEDIKINHSENIIINIKHASIDDVEQVLPGYTKELYINDYSSCKLCWNCCHEFSNQSTCIPLKYLNNVFYIYGHFCSHECGARYIFDNFNDKNKWDIYSLLNLYNNLSNNTFNEKVKPAPNKLLLKNFGGKMDIKDYRLTKKIFSLELPPIIPIEHTISEVSDSNSIKEVKEQYKLYRKKELNSKNNIYNTMNLQS